MDPARNPFTPSPGFKPPELAGRSGELKLRDAALAALTTGRTPRPTIIYGLRGVGKTVLLNEVEDKARHDGCHVIFIEATDKSSLGITLANELQRVLGRLSSSAKAKQFITRAVSAVQEVLEHIELSYGDAKVTVKGRGAAAVSGQLDAYLREAMVAVGEAAGAAGASVLICIDELQTAQLREEGKDLSALMSAIHRAGQKNLPVGIVAAGLPQIHGILTRLRSYTERFQYVEVGALPLDEARRAIKKPIKTQGADIEDDALEYIVSQTAGYPAFLQEYGFHTWNVAEGPAITLADATAGHQTATEALDRGFYEARMQRITEREKDYIYAMASLGSGPYDSSAVAKQLGESAQAVSPYRDGLIKKGMIWSPQRGEIEFTVPMFDAFLRRREPDLVRPAPAPSPSSKSRKK